ncbi:MAG: NnrU family protein [Betaproteobacteria bacterium]
MMTMFFSGLLLFFTLHFAAATPLIRRRIVTTLGEMPWKGVVSLGSLGAITLICFGWSETPNTLLFAPNAWAFQYSPILVSSGLVLFVIGGGNLNGYIRRALHHPMLIGIMLWATTHLLANGGLRETWLFGSFLAFALYSFCSLWLAGKRATFTPALKWDFIGLGIGLFISIGVMHGHKWLYGVAVPLY